jgi:WD repeat-containing protein 42A
MQEFVHSLGLQKRLQKHKRCVDTLSFNSSGSLFMSASHDQTIALWNLEEAVPRLMFQAGGDVSDAQFMPLSDDRSIVTCGADGEVYRCFHAACLSASVADVSVLSFFMLCVMFMVWLFGVVAEQVRHSLIREGGCVFTDKLTDLRYAVNKLAVDPGSPHTFFSCVEDGSVLLVSC